MVSARLLRGDVLRFCEHYHGPRFHALLCDPPYHLTSIVKRFGNSTPSSHMSAQTMGNSANTPHKRTARGFMGKRWDGGDIAFDPSTWAALASLLHPGAFGMAFASSRGWHRLAVAIEDAGLIIHPSIFGWAFGSGFPKATRIDTQVDRAAGAERTEVERTWSGGMRRAGIMGENLGTQTRPITAPATPLAAAWAGHRYGLQALKPALEPIIVFQVPYQGRPVDSITATGAGALNINQARISWVSDEDREAQARAFSPKSTAWTGGHHYDNETANFACASHGPANPTSPAGRWPANFALVCSESCNGAHAPGCPVAALDEQAGERKAGTAVKRNLDGHTYNEHQPWGLRAKAGDDVGYGDTGTASRFFHRAAWELEHADPVLYQAKASRRERDAGLEGWDANIPDEESWKTDFAKYGSGDAHGNRMKQRTIRNSHPTVKPIALSRWLATLLLPPAEYAPRRLLIPFAGVGSEMIGAGLAGWDEVVGVEGEAEYVSIGRARLAHWLRQPELVKP